HFNFWPLVPDLTATRDGAPWPELREPGQVMDDMDQVFADPSTAVRQLNHPYILDKLGRDQGYPRAIGYDPTTPIAAGASFAADALLHRPNGEGHHANLDWDVQEVMTGASRADWLRYRALWFSLLSQGYLRAGAANSDTHTLSVERIGYPRNLVWGNHQKAALDVDAFDADVRAGHMEGTNGPVLDVTIDDGLGRTQRPGLTPIALSSTAAMTISVTAAPWIPVTEARVFVNGQLVRTFDLSSVFAEAIGDRFGTQPGRGSITLLLAPLLPTKGDAWLVVEAGLHQETPPDTDGDGLPDFKDDAPARPTRVDDPRFDLQAIAPGVWPTAFSNPFLLNLDGGDWTPPGLPP
ncbi:MAG TPA: hypothetical protein VKO16_04695, partial [Polyangia bacterium]|nr:hypothetical protein [Polyangia bacterium]